MHFQHIIRNHPYEVATVLLMNIVPVIGVIGAGWHPVLVFVFYALETVVAGIFNIPKLWLSARAHPGSQIMVNDKKQVFSGLGLSAFFLFHYGFFVFVQMTLFFGALQLKSSTFNGITLDDGVFSAWTNLYRLAGPEMGIILGTMGFSYLVHFIHDYLIGDKATRMPPGKQMAEPYIRIFIQQFVVIFFGFIAILQAGSLGLLIIFVIVKSVADIIILQKGDTWLQSLDFGNKT